MTRVLKVVFYALLLAALAGGVVLVRQTQETRRGAASNDVGMSLQPSGGNYQKGDQIEVQLFINTGAGSDSNVLWGYTANLKYDPTKLKYIDKSVTVNSEMVLANDGLPYDIGETNPDTGAKLCVQNETTGLYNCSEVCKCAFGVEKNGLGTLMVVMYRNSGIVASPAIKVATMKFEVLADTGEADIGFDGSNNVAVGSDADTEWEVTTKTGASYTIGGVTETAILSPTAGAVTNTPVPTVAGTPECEGAIKKCVGEVPTWCLSGKWEAMSVCGTGKVCDAGVCTDLTVEPTVKPTLVPIPTVDDHALYLNFKTTIQGVAVGSLCANSWRASVILKSGVGTTMVYRNVPLVRSDIVSGIPTYNGTVRLEGWTEKTNLLVFIKGEKHMQMKYGQDNQVAAFPETVGKLTVSEGTSSPIYNFTGYPLMPGDVNQDGMINGDDFSLIKTKTQTYETVAEGDADAIYDLDGNCQLNTIDIDWLSKSLNTRQDEIY